MDFNNIYEELSSNMTFSGNQIQLERYEIDNFQPVSNLVIDEGDFLYSYVDAFMKRKMTDDISLYVGIRNIESSA